MSNWNDYKPVESENSGTGKRRCFVIAAEETTSKTSGLPMWVITVTPNGGRAKVKQYIVKNEYFDENMTRFFDSFGIDRGDFNSLGWIGAVGAANFGEDENGYLKVIKFLTPKQAESISPWAGPLPERQTITALKPMGDNTPTPFDDPEDELPL